MNRAQYNLPIMQVLRRLTSNRIFRGAVCVSALCMLTACASERGSNLAIDKLTVEQQQATNFLPLNPDSPGTPVEVVNYLVPGKYTIVAYFSPRDEKSVEIEPK